MRFKTTALLLVTGAIGLGFAGTAFAACGAPGGGTYGGGTYGGYDPAPPVNVTVTAPRFQPQFFKLNVPPPTATISQRVQTADLDLCTPAGRQALRARTVAAAHNVCTQLKGVYEHGLPSQPSCERDAMAGAQPKVNFAIAAARGER